MDDAVSPQEINNLVCAGKVIGKIADLEKFTGKYRFGIIAIGNADTHYLYTSRFEENCYQIPALVHLRTFVGKYAWLGKGCVVETMATIRSGSELGIGILISASAVVNHSVFLDDYCHIGAGCVVAERFVIKMGTKLDSGKIFYGLDDLSEDGIQMANRGLGALDVPRIGCGSIRQDMERNRICLRALI